MKDHKLTHRMIDNRIVTSSRQRGIERILQRPEDKKDLYGYCGKMNSHSGKADFARKGESLTPRKA